jgi:tetratricopeptide (TPR) repeat protein
MDKEFDILSQYKNISNRVKRRFLKKPNISEGSEQFGSLAKQLRSQDCPHYAGFCHLAQARCEHTLGNSVAEANSLTEAGRCFLQAEDTSKQLNVLSLEEHLNAAINCYSHAIRVHLENRHCDLAAGLSIELAHALKSVGRPAEAIQHYQRAAELQLQNPSDCLMTLSYIATAKIAIGDHEGALTVLTEMTYLAHERAAVLSASSFLPIGSFADILASCEISRVLLLLLLQPTTQRIRPEHAEILERYSWGKVEVTDTSTTSHEGLSEDVFLLMQSVVMACRTRDLSSLKHLQTDLWPLLSAEQNHLLHLVVTEFNRPSGQD